MRMALLLAVAYIPFLFFCMYVSSRAANVFASFETALNTGIGYPIKYADRLTGILALLSDMKGWLPFGFLGLLLPGPFLAGVFNVARLLACRHTGIKVFKVFFEGVRKHWWKYTVIFTVFVAALFGAAFFSLYLYESSLTDGLSPWGIITLVLIAAVDLTLFIFMSYCFVMIPVYGISFRDILKNSALYTLGLYPLNIIIAAVTAAPLLLILTGSQTVIIILVIVFVVFFNTLYPLAWTFFGDYGFTGYTDKLYEIEEAEQTQRLNTPAKKVSGGKNKKDTAAPKTKNAKAENSLEAKKVSGGAGKRPVKRYENPKKKKKPKV